MKIAHNYNIQYNSEKDLCISCQHLAYHDPIVVGSWPWDLRQNTFVGNVYYASSGKNAYSDFCL